MSIDIEYLEGEFEAVVLRKSHMFQEDVEKQCKNIQGNVEKIQRQFLKVEHKFWSAKALAKVKA